MRFHVLASDYDGTLAAQGKVASTTLQAVQRLHDSGRKLILVTGRELKDLCKVFPEIGVCDLVVAENGALLWDPKTKSSEVLGEHPPEAFVRELRKRGVEPLSVGEVVVATSSPNEKIVLEVIRELGLELQVVFNKGAVMVLPTGINKAFGLKAALKRLGYSPLNVVAVGDAENDHALLKLAGRSVAVENAIESLKDEADWVTPAVRGEGVVQLIERLLHDDLQSVAAKQGELIALGTRRDSSQTVSLPAFGTRLLIAGPSGSGKSTTATAILERLQERGIQFCLIDPEGDYEGLESAVTAGTVEHAPDADHVLELLETFQSVVINLLGVPLNDRPLFFAELLPKIQELRVRTGRPHWLVIDEAHHLLPSTWRPAPSTLPQDPGSLMMITVHPERMAEAALESVNCVIAVGESPGETIEAVPKVSAAPSPTRLREHEVLYWSQEDSPQYTVVRVQPGNIERLRHLRKYAEGDVHEKSFYFRGPDGKLNLRAQNLSIFLQMAEGVDDETWMHHLRNRDYSKWIRYAIKDAKLADEVENIERSPADSRQTRLRVKDAIEQSYTGAA